MAIRRVPLFSRFHIFILFFTLFFGEFGNKMDVFFVISFFWKKKDIMPFICETDCLLRIIVGSILMDFFRGWVGPLD